MTRSRRRRLSRRDEAALAAAAASRRLDDTFRSYLADRGVKQVPLADATPARDRGRPALRLAADAVLELWQSDSAQAGDRGAARRELLGYSASVVGLVRTAGDGARAPRRGARIPGARAGGCGATGGCRRPRSTGRRRPRDGDRGAGRVDRRPPGCRPSTRADARRLRPGGDHARGSGRARSPRTRPPPRCNVSPGALSLRPAPCDRAARSAGRRC